MNNQKNPFALPLRSCSKPIRFIRFHVVYLFLGILSVSARVDYPNEFAPTDPFIKPPEELFRSAISLNGRWDFQPVSLPRDFKEGVDPAPELTAPDADAWEKTPLKIPSPWNVNSFANAKGLGGDFQAYPSYPEAWNEVKMGWMRRSVTVPAAWQGRRVLLHFDAVAGDIRIQVNGKEAGKRFDLFFPFDLDVTDLVRFGAANEILVGVRKASLFDVRGKYGRRLYQGGSFWGQHAAGIWQDVTLVSVPVVRVEDVFVQPLVEQDLLKAVITLRNDSSSDITVDISGSVYPWVSLAGKSVEEIPTPRWKLDATTALNLSPATVTIPAQSEQSVSIEHQVGQFLRFWSPDEPALYALLVDVKVNGQPVDRKYTRFGWREIRLNGSQVLLNDKPIVFKGDSWHFLGIPQMTRRYAWAWFTALREAHGNAVRLHAQPYPAFYLDVADEMGIMVLDETAIWASDGGPKLDADAFWKDTEDHLAQLVRRDRNHPSVFGWSVCNEVSPIVRNVFHGPPGMFQKLVGYYSIWAGICRHLDLTRPWISADGDDDGEGALPIYSVHYGGMGAMERAAKSGKPWGVGEASGAYYMTPEEAAKTNGERAYESFEGRMEAIAADSYENLSNQGKLNANYRSVFNLVWYGLQPLPLGLADTARPPSLADGIFFPSYVEGKPGVQPERLGPYCTTLNPGYDPSLPSYRPWPLFDAIKDANAQRTVNSVRVLAGSGGKLQAQLASMGVAFDALKASDTPDLLFIDGSAPPEASARATMEQTLMAGGTVVVWGPRPDALPQLNVLLPMPLELTSRKSSSLLPEGTNPVIAGLKPSDLYFSELSPPIILENGLGGPLAAQSSVLLKACDTDWLLWNKRPEYAKTAMIMRSELEAKASGAALIQLEQGKGRLLVCNLSAEPKLYKGQVLVRRLLENLGIPLQPSVDVGEPLLKTGQLIRVLAAGRFTAEDGETDQAFVNPASGSSMEEHSRIHGKRWISLAAEKGTFDLMKDPLNGPSGASPSENAFVYLSFWVLSPRSLDNLLLEPNVPRVDFVIHTGDNVQLWLNGKSLLKNAGGVVTAPALPLQQGWNHFLLRLVHGKGGDAFSAELVCSQPEFFLDLKSALQKP